MISIPHPDLSLAGAPSAPAAAPLSALDESLLLSLLDAGPPLAFLIRQARMTLQQAIDWWSQPHIKAALAAITDLSQARARAIAANDAAQAVTALQSCVALSDTEFYEQADPKTRLKAFESARKAAVQVLRLAGIATRVPRASRVSRAITCGSAQVMPPVPDPPASRAITCGSAQVMFPDAPRGSARDAARVMSTNIERQAAPTPETPLPAARSVRKDREAIPHWSG